VLEIVCHLPRLFLLELKYSFYFFPTLLLTLSRFGFHPTFMFYQDAFFQIHHDSLVLSNRFLAFKMGVKEFRTGTIVMSLGNETF